MLQLRKVQGLSVGGENNYLRLDTTIKNNWLEYNNLLVYGDLNQWIAVAHF